MEGDPDALLTKAAAHQTAARAVEAQDSSAFLLSPNEPGQSKFAVVAPVSAKNGKHALVNSARGNARDSSNRMSGDKEAFQVFSTQLPHKPTSSAISSPIFSSSGPDPLPGGVPVVDHLAAWLKSSPDWAEAVPIVERLRNSRIPTADATNNSRELTLGVSTPQEWQEATEFVKKSTAGHADMLIPFCAADTESTALEVTWPTMKGESAWDALLSRIALDAVIGEQEKVFTIATPGVTACGLPTRFFYGGPEWQVHVRLPTRQFTENGVKKIALSLNTELSSEVLQFFLSLGSAVGSGITADYVEWSQILDNLWGTKIVEQMEKPVELEHLARLARINTGNSSIFHLNWWCFGTVLPKRLASLGDGKWGRPLNEIPSSLRQYLSADIAQTANLAALFIIIWVAQSYPDMTIVKDASSFTTITFIQWITQQFLRPQTIGRKKIDLDSNGRWKKVVPDQGWTVHTDIHSFMSSLSLPNVQEHAIIWKPLDCPAITSGGPRFLHQARSAFIEQLPALRSLDPDSWVVHHEDKKLFWRYGLSRETVSKPSSAPVNQPGLVASPELESRLPLDPFTWKSATFQSLITSHLRGERVLILEFMRLHPDRAKFVLEMAESDKRRFREILKPRRMLRMVQDIRQMLGHLNIKMLRPEGWVDPYHVQEVIQKNQEKSIKHLQTQLTHYMANQESYASRIIVAQQALASVDPSSIPTRFDDTSLIRKAIAADGTALKGKAKRSIHRDEKLGTGKDDLEPPRKVVFRETSPAIQENRTIRVVVPEDEPMIVEAPVAVNASSSTNHTDDMKDLIRRTMMVGDTEVIRNVPGSQVNGSDIRTLADGEKLNDSVVEAYFKMIGARSGQNGFRSAHVFDTFFYSKLAAQGFTDVRDWSRGADIFGHDLIIFPVHTTGHWTLAIVDMRQQTLTYYDSLPSTPRATKVLNIIYNYLVKEYQDKKGRELYIGFSRSHPYYIPHQDNIIDCGVFMCQFAEYISRSAPFKFSQSDIPMIRELMVWEIASNKLLGESSSTT